MCQLKQHIRSKSTLLVVLSLALIAVISVEVPSAYFSGSDEVKNTLSIGKVEISLDEPNWEPEKGLGLTPGQPDRQGSDCYRGGRRQLYAYQNGDSGRRG